jgi:hypothetical protein
LDGGSLGFALFGPRAGGSAGLLATPPLGGRLGLSEEGGNSTPLTETSRRRTSRSLSPTGQLLRRDFHPQDQRRCRLQSVHGLAVFPLEAIAMSFVLAWLAKRGSSVWPAALGHGANSALYAPLLIVPSDWLADQGTAWLSL